MKCGARKSPPAFCPKWQGEGGLVQLVITRRSGDAEFLLQARRGSRVLESDLRIGICIFECGLRHQRGFVEARQNELQLARIGVDVTNRKNTWLARLELFRINSDQVLMQVEAPIRNRAEFHRQTEEGQQRVAFDLIVVAIIALRSHAGELAIIAMQRRDLAEMELD